MPGYDDTGETVIFTNVESIRKYVALWASAFDDDTVHWMSKTTKNRRGILEGYQTFNDKAFYNENTQAPPSPPTWLDEPEIHKFATCQEAIAYFRGTLKPIFEGRGPSTRQSQNDAGFYTRKHQGSSKVFSCEDVYGMRRHYVRAGKRSTRYSMVPCYRDVSDSTTLEWWVIHVRL